MNADDRAIPQFGDSRPLMWWALPPKLWKPHWRFSEVPLEWQETTRINHAKRKAEGRAGY